MDLATLKHESDKLVTRIVKNRALVTFFDLLRRALLRGARINNPLIPMLFLSNLALESRVPECGPWIAQRLVPKRAGKGLNRPARKGESKNE
jgi:hypothetical protein